MDVLKICCFSFFFFFLLCVFGKKKTNKNKLDRTIGVIVQIALNNNNSESDAVNNTTNNPDPENPVGVVGLLSIFIYFYFYFAFSFCSKLFFQLNQYSPLKRKEFFLKKNCIQNE